MTRFALRCFLLSLLFMMMVAAIAFADIVIDDFSVPQGPISAISTTNDHNADNASIFGGERNLHIVATNTQGGTLQMEVTSTGFPPEEALTMKRPSFNGNVSQGELSVWWDGDNDSDTFNPNFLAATPQNLTASGTLNAFRIAAISSSDESVALRIEVYSTSANSSVTHFGVPASGGDVDLRFSDFTPVAGTGANFASVTAILIRTESNVSATEFTAAIDSISTITMDPRATVETGPNDFRISSAGIADGDNATVETPAIASNGAGEALVVWQQFSKLQPSDAAAQSEIFGHLIDTNTGALIGPDFKISDMGGTTAPSAFFAVDPDVVYNATSDEYFVVWRGDDDEAPLVNDEYEIFGQRVNSNGSLDGNNIRISFMGTNGVPGPSVENPAITWDSVDNRYLVVWSANDSASSEIEIYGRILNPDGTSFSVDDTRISNVGTDLDLSRSAIDPDVAFDPSPIFATPRYLVVWSGDPDADNAFDIYGQFISPTGTEDGTDFRISDLGDSDTNPAYDANTPRVAFSVAEDLYVVAFSGSDDTTGIGNNEVFVRTVTGSGGVLQFDIQISEQGPFGDPAYGAFQPDVASKAGGDGFLVVWRGDGPVNDEFEIWAQRLTCDIIIIEESPFRISDMGPPGVPSPIYDADHPAAVYTTGPAVVVWRGEDDIGINKEIEVYGQLLKTTASGATTTITADPTTAVVSDFDGPVITLQVKDAAGNDIETGGHAIVLSSNIGTFDPVEDVEDGTYTAVLRSTVAGTATITGTIDNEAITDTATVTFTPGSLDTDACTITANPTSIVANGTSTSTITVQLKDEFGNNLPTDEGVTVTLQTNHGTLGSVTNHSDGTFTATLTSTTVLETASITGEIDAVPIGDDANVTFISGPATSLNVNAPATATGGTPFNVTVTARDAQNHTASGYTGTVHFTSSTSPATLPSDYTFTGGDAGAHLFSVTLGSAGNTTLTVTDTVTGSITGNDTVTVKGNTTTLLTSDDSSSIVGQSVTFTATVSSTTTGTISGNVTFKDGAAGIGTVTLSGGTATFSTSTLIAGTHSITAVYNGNTDFNTSTSNAVSQVVTFSPFGAPEIVTATASSTTQVALSWTPVSTATSYRIYRSSLGSAYGFVTGVTGTTFNDIGLTASRTYLYKVSAFNGTESAQSLPDATTTIFFTDPTLSTSIGVKAIHVNELRTAVNAMRAAAPLGATTFTDPTLTPQSTLVKRLHITELRTALDAARSMIGLPAITYTDPTITTDSTSVKAAHVAQLRAGTQ